MRPLRNIIVEVVRHVDRAITVIDQLQALPGWDTEKGRTTAKVAWVAPPSEAPFPTHRETSLRAPKPKARLSIERRKRET